MVCITIEDMYKVHKNIRKPPIDYIEVYELTTCQPWQGILSACTLELCDPRPIS